MSVSRENSGRDSLSTYFVRGYGLEGRNCEILAIGQPVSDTMPCIGQFLSVGGIYLRQHMSLFDRRRSLVKDKFGRLSRTLARKILTLRGNNTETTGRGRTKSGWGWAEKNPQNRLKLLDNRDRVR
jgi:hypothetical protein